MSRKNYEDKYQGLSYNRKDYLDRKVDLDDENEVAVEEETVDALSPLIDEVKEEEPKPEYLKARVKVLSNVREEPNIGSNVLYILQAGTEVKIQEHPGDFYIVAYGNHPEAYIKKDLCEKI